MPDLPRGTVTLLFTDVEGSTQLVRMLRDRYAQVRADHERLLREAVEAHGGFEIDMQGDSFLVAFRTAKDALSAAVAAQRALASRVWPEGVQLRVRMGIHTGEPEVVDGRYVGLPVHRAARIMALGHGAQILVSEATRKLIDEDELEGIVFRDLGEHRLKDFPQAERVFQVEAEGLPSEFAPLKTLVTQPTELPFTERATDTEQPRRRRRLLTDVILAVAAAALISILAALVPLFISDSEGCPKEGASLTNLAVEPNIRFRDFLEQTNASAEGYADRQLDALVNKVAMDTQIDGYKGKHLILKWSAYDAETRSAAGDPSLRNRPALDVEPSACTTRLRAVIWTPSLPRQGRFYLKLALHDEAGNVLAEARTSPL